MIAEVFHLRPCDMGEIKVRHLAQMMRRLEQLDAQHRAAIAQAAAPGRRRR